MRHCFAAACAALALMLAPGLAWSQAASTGSGQAYPTRLVKIIVPFAAGGPADIYARVLGEKLQAALGQPFVVEDRPGGGAIVGTDAVAKSAPDGYTLLMMSNTHTVNESLIRDKPYQLLRDLTPVAPVNYSDLVMVVHPSVPAANARGVHRARPAPGPGRSTTPRRVRARRTTWPASSSRRWRASTSCTCPTREARARAPTSSAARCR